MDRFGDCRIIIARFQSDFALTPVVACEIEFYLHGSEVGDLEAFWNDVRQACQQQNISIYKTEKERGREQYEIALAPTDAVKAAGDATALKAIISSAAENKKWRADFSAKPFSDQPGSGLHVHVHLENADGKNVFHKDDARMSEPLEYCIGGLLADLQHSMPVFAPTEASRKRFVPGGNAPLTVSWGANNRTVAVRLPDSPHNHKRIEHRVAGADADPEKVIEVILAAMHDGLIRKLKPGPQCYGDASLPQYNLPKLF